METAFYYGLIAGTAAVIVIVFFALVGPWLTLYSQTMKGKADLAQSHYDQQIQVAEAKGRFDAAELNKRAAIVEAEAVKAEIDIIGQELTTHNLYLQWQWIEMMRDRDGATIYVPTEAGLPVLEAGRVGSRLTQ